MFFTVLSFRNSFRYNNKHPLSKKWIDVVIHQQLMSCQVTRNDIVPMKFTDHNKEDKKTQKYNTMPQYATLVNEAIELASDKKIPQACYKLALAINESRNTKQLLQINSELPALLTQITKEDKSDAQKYFDSIVESSQELRQQNAALLCTAGLYEDEQTAFLYLNKIIDANDQTQHLTFVADFLIGENYINMKMFEDSVTHIRKCIAGLDWFHYAHYVLSTSLINAKKYEEALTSISRAIELIQSDDLTDEKINELCVEYFLLRAKTYYQLKDYDQSIVDFSNVINLDSGNVVALVTRAKLYLQLKNYDAAHADFDRVIATYQNYGSYINTLKARAYRQEKKYQEACEAYDKVFSCDKKWKDSFDIYECFLEKALLQKLFLKDLEGAKQTYDKCIKRYPEKPEPYWLRGKLYDQSLNRKEEAQSDFKHAITLITESENPSSYSKLLSDIQSHLSV